MTEPLEKFVPQKHREKMDHTLNGPTRPNKPAMSSFMVEDAENEIRRNVQRHYEQQAAIAELTTDRDHWRHRAELAEAECVRLEAKLRDADARADELKDTITTLRTQFETGINVWLGAYKTLQEAAHPLRIVAPEALQLKQENQDDPRDHYRTSDQGDVPLSDRGS